jgi:formate--tetrahydrofolate ligase
MKLCYVAHAANSIVANRIALKLADSVIAEAGFASDLGFQKFGDIVCLTARLTPSAAVLSVVRPTRTITWDNCGPLD